MIKGFVRKMLRACDGAPDYVARGLAIGVLVGITPTVPFQTALALALAALCRGSKPAAVLGIWSGNPLTMPLLYALSYRLGVLLSGHNAAELSMQHQSFLELLTSGAGLFCATIAAGVLIGIPPALAVYYICRAAMRRLRPLPPGRARPGFHEF